MKTITKKVIVNHPDEIAKYLKSDFQVIRLGSLFCLRYAEKYWSPQIVKDSIEQITCADKAAEFQTFIAPSSSKHIRYTKACLEIMEETRNPPKVVVGDVGLLGMPYSGKKIASSFLKISNELDMAFLIDLGVMEVGINGNQVELETFISTAHRLELKVEVTNGNPPVFLGWKCYFDHLYPHEGCGYSCRNTTIPLFSPSEKKPVLRIKGKTIYSENKVTTETCSADSSVLYPSMSSPNLF